MGDNDEVQDVKGRAERIKALRFKYQEGKEVIQVSIDEQGVVKFKFSGDPDEAMLLGALNRLNTHIGAHSSLNPITIR